MRAKNQRKIRGVLNPKNSEKHYQLTRFLPTKRLSGFVEQYWFVEWDLPSTKAHVQQNIPDPCVHLVFEQNKAYVTGVVTKKYSHSMSGKGEILGVKFHPGGFYPLLESAVTSITDTRQPLEQIFREGGATLALQVANAISVSDAIDSIETFLDPRLPKGETKITLLKEIVNRVEQDRVITKVEHLVEHFDLSKRALQRLFRTYVGVSPKWLIRKYRIHEAMEQLDNGERDWHKLIVELEYFDQAHFIKDFKSMTGLTPEQYLGKQYVHNAK